MKPEENKYNNPKNPLHSIEWGKSTWDNKSFSIRNRYNLENGKFNKAGSGEIPWEDFKKMIVESIKRDYFSSKEIGLLLKTISEKLLSDE